MSTHHPSLVMPTDSSPPTDTLDICPCCLGPAAAHTLLQCPAGLGGKGDTQVTPGSPAGQRDHSLMSTCSKGRGQAGTSPCAAHIPPGTQPPAVPQAGLQHPQESDLPVPEALGAVQSPQARRLCQGSQLAAVLDEPHFPISPIFPSHPHGAPRRAWLPRLEEPLTPAVPCNDLSQGSLQSLFGELRAAQPEH